MATLRLNGSMGNSLVVCLKRIMTFGRQQGFTATVSLSDQQISYLPFSQGLWQKLPFIYNINIRIWIVVFSNWPEWISLWSSNLWTESQVSHHPNKATYPSTMMKQGKDDGNSKSYLEKGEWETPNLPVQSNYGVLLDMYYEDVLSWRWMNFLH